EPLNSNTSLQAFVDDLNDLLEHGVLISGTQLEVRLGALICDAPAKAYVLSIVHHNGYFSCTKCTAEGEALNRRQCFPEMNAELRTNESFRTRKQEEHHRGTTLLETLPIDLIRQVPLDYMHLVLLGVMKKLLLLWLKGPKKYRL
ncbi:unnamed protein product, partial [Ixodes hexagonus]